MSIQHLLRRLAVALGLTLIIFKMTTAQELPNPPSEPVFVPYVGDMQLFEQPDLSRYGSGVRPPAGYYGSAEYLNWSTKSPDRTPLGNPGVMAQSVFGNGATTNNTGNISMTMLNNSGTGIPVQVAGINIVPSSGVSQGTLFNGTTQINTNDTQFLASPWESGSRFEFGYKARGRGWMVSTFNLGSQTQTLDTTNVSMNFTNQPVGFVDIEGPNNVPTPGTFNNTRVLGDGFDDDLDGDGIFGRFGRDRGTQAGTVFNPPFDGIPDRESPIANNGSYVQIPIDYDDAVILPTIFDELHVENVTKTWGVEFNRIWDIPLSPYGGVWEIFAGPRYIECTDRYTVVGTVDNTNPRYYLNPLGDSYWNTIADNHIFGGQVGARWAMQVERWQFAVETRGIAAANFQDINQDGAFGSLANTFVPTPTAAGLQNAVFRDDVINMQLPNSFRYGVNSVQFTPGMELRANLKYQVFRSVYLTLGYTGLYANGIARSSKMVNYNLPGMGIRADQNRDALLLQGVNFGIVINR